MRWLDGITHSMGMCLGRLGVGDGQVVLNSYKLVDDGWYHNHKEPSDGGSHYDERTEYAKDTETQLALILEELDHGKQQV